MQSKLKYLIVGDGASPHLLKWVNALSEYYELYLISSRAVLPETSSFLQQDRVYSLNLTLDPNGGNLKVISALPRLIKLVRLWKPDIINAHYLTSYGVLVAAGSFFFSRKIMLIQSAWGSDILVTPRKNLVYRLITKFALQRGQLITSDAQIMTSAIKRMTNTRVETFVFGLNSLPAITLEEKTPLSFFSNRAHTTNYRIDHVLVAFSLISSRYPEARLVIANNGPETASLQKLAQKLHLTEIVSFTGFLTAQQQAHYYRYSQFYFSLPESDSTSVSLLEAMAWGCIPIVSNLEANQEWIVDMKNGVYESNDLVDKIGELLIAHAQIMAMNRQIITERAFFPVLIQRFTTLVQTLVSS